jgi:regulator of RNase E activity RraA
MVIDNGGREDEACIGDLTVIEMRLAGLAGMIVWGRHRDTDDLLAIELPVFSIGSFPAGPRRLDPRTPDAFDRARIGDLEITRQDAVFADDDGIIFVPLAAVEGVMGAAEKIQHTETRQAERVRQGASLRGQFRFEEYLRQRAADPAYTLREHLLKVGGEIEV